MITRQVKLCLELETQQSPSRGQFIQSRRSSILIVFNCSLSQDVLMLLICGRDAGVRPPWWAVDLQRLARRWGRRAARDGGWSHTEAVRPPRYETAGAHKQSPSKSQREYRGGEGQFLCLRFTFQTLFKNARYKGRNHKLGLQQGSQQVKSHSY